MENISAYVAARAAGILVGSSIIKRELVKNKDWEAIAGLSRAFVEKVEEALSAGSRTSQI